MRFLIDAQLPPALAHYLIQCGHQADHVVDVAMANASDRRIWQYAEATGATLITKDEDFVTMRALSRNSGPAVIWVRVGNTTTKALLAIFEAVLAGILEAVERGETVIQLPGQDR